MVLAPREARSKPADKIVDPVSVAKKQSASGAATTGPVAPPIDGPVSQATPAAAATVVRDGQVMEAGKLRSLPRPPEFSVRPTEVFPDLRSSEDVDWLTPSPESTAISVDTKVGDKTSAEHLLVGSTLESSGVEHPNNESSAVPSEALAEEMELLDDNLFQDLEHLDSDPDDQPLKIEGVTDTASSMGQVVSVRCRVCDTLQYVENLPGKKPVCDVCHAPIPLNDDGTPINTKRQGRGGWTTPSTVVRNVSVEGVGSIGPERSAEGDEIDELIRTVQIEAVGATVVEETSKGLPSGDETEHELRLAPIDISQSSVGLDLLLIEDETRSLLQQPAEDLIETDINDLVPVEDNGSDELVHPGVSGNSGSGGQRVRIDNRKGPKDKGPTSEPDGLPASSEPLDPLLDDDHPFGMEREPSPVERGPARRATASLPEHVAPPPVTLNPAPAMWVREKPSDVPGRPIAASPATPPVFVPPRADSADDPTTADPSGKTGPKSLGRSDEQVEQFLQRAVVSLWHLLRSIRSPFGSWQLLGTAVLLLPLVVLMQTSWNAAVGDGEAVEKITGYCYLLLSSAAGVPLWLALLGVIANRQSALGQDGRLSWPAIALQAGQFAVVLALAMPGAAVGTPSGLSLLVGCLAAYTMLPAGLYFVTSAIVAHDWFAFRHPAVSRSFSELLADWAAAGVVVGLIMLVGTLMALITAFMETIGPTLFGMFIIPTSMAYAATIGYLADRILTLTEQ